MGKTVDDLKLPPDETPLPRPTDVRDTEWYKFAREIDDLIASGTVDWATDTLQDIQTTVEKLQRVSQAQRNAVANIEAAGQRRQDGRRRYEGFGNRRY